MNLVRSGSHVIREEHGRIHSRPATGAMEDYMRSFSVRKWVPISVVLGLLFARTALAGAANSPDPKALEKRQNFIAMIKRPHKEMLNKSGESMRSFYVARLSELDSSVLDAETQTLFADLIEKDEDDWVRLEAAADVAYLPLAGDKLQRVNGLLEKCRTDERVNFQVLASQSLLEIGRKQKKANLAAEKTLAKIAQGQDMAKWMVMIPPHNVGMMIADPASKAQIHFEDFYKTNLRIKAINALSQSKDDFSKKVLTDLTKDGNAWVRETAKSGLAH